MVFDSFQLGRAPKPMTLSSSMLSTDQSGWATVARQIDILRQRSPRSRVSIRKETDMRSGRASVDSSAIRSSPRSRRCGSSSVRSIQPHVMRRESKSSPPTRESEQSFVFVERQHGSRALVDSNKAARLRCADRECLRRAK